MISVNLIPARRRDARRRHVRVRRWITGCCAYALVLSAGFGSWRGAWSVEQRDLTRELAQLGNEIAQSQQATAALRLAAGAAGRSLESNRAVADQPDWSVLLALLARIRGDDLVLDHWQLQPVDGPGGTEVLTVSAVARGVASGRPPRLALRLSGHGRTAGAVSEFVLRLERTGLFESVALLKTAREPFMGEDAVDFKLHCLLRGNGAEPPQPPAVRVGADAGGVIP